MRTEDVGFFAYLDQIEARLAAGARAMGFERNEPDTERLVTPHERASQVLVAVSEESERERLHREVWS